MNQTSGNLVLPLAISLVLASLAWADPPELTHTTPLAVFPGRANQVVFHGQRLQPVQQLWCNLPGQAMFTSNQPEAHNTDKSVRSTIEVPADAPLGIYTARLVTNSGVSSPILFLVDDLKSTEEIGSNRNQHTAQLLQAPGAVDGAGAGAESDYYCLDMVDEQWLTVEIVAARLGYAFDPLLRIFDDSGNNLAVVDDSPGLHGDCQVRFRSAKDQRVYLQVSDARLSNSARHKYRLRVGDFPLKTACFPLASELPNNRYIDASLPSIEVTNSKPNDTMETALSIDVPSAIDGRFVSSDDEHYFRIPLMNGDRLKVTGIARSFGSAADLWFKLLDPAGKIVATHDDSGLDEANFEFIAAGDGDHYISIREINRQFGPAYCYRCEITRAKPSFELIAKTDRLNIGQGGVGLLAIDCIRSGYNGPVTLQLDQHQTDYQLANHIIDAGANETLLQVIPKAELPVGSLNMIGIQGVGKSEDVVGDHQRPTAWLNVSDSLRKQFPSLPYPPSQLQDQIAVAIAKPLPSFFGLRLASDEILFPRIVGETYFTVFCIDRLDGFKEPINLAAVQFPDKVKTSGYEKPVGNSQNNEYRFAINGPADLPLGTQMVSIRGVGEHLGQSQEVFIRDIPFRVIEPLMVTIEISKPPKLSNELNLRITARRFVARKGGDRKEIICRWKAAPTWLVSPDRFVIEAGRNEQTFVLPIRQSSDNAQQLTSLVMLAETSIDGQIVRVETEPYEVEDLAVSTSQPD